MRDGNGAAAEELQDIIVQRKLYPEITYRAPKRRTISISSSIRPTVGALHVELFHEKEIC